MGNAAWGSIDRLRLTQRWLWPTVGALFSVYFAQQEATRDGFLGNLFVFLLLGAAIGLSWLKPWMALGIAFSVPALQVLRVLTPPSSTTWPAYGAVAVVGLVTAFRVNGTNRFLVLASGGVIAATASLCMAWPTRANGFGWRSWTGGVVGPADTHPIRADFAVLTLASFGLFALFWGVGTAISALTVDRALSRAQTELAEQEFNLRLNDDRERIAREIHDALAHSLAVVVAQAEGAAAIHHLRPEVIGTTLENISDVGRAALLDVRRLIESIHDDEPSDVTPRPATRDLLELTDRMRNSGMNLEFQETGRVQELPATVDLTVFRIVQEALTNALKHAGTQATVNANLHWGDDTLEIDIDSVGTRPLFGPKVKRVRGVGIEGMRERARLAGGRLETVNREGHFVVQAIIPLTTTREGGPNE